MVGFKKFQILFEFYLQTSFYLEKSEKNFVLDGKLQMVKLGKTKSQFRVKNDKLIYHRLVFFSKESIKYLFQFLLHSLR